MNTKSDRERYRLMLFINIVLKEYENITKIMHIILNNHNITNIILFIILIYCVISNHSVIVFNQSFAVFYANMYLSLILI